VLVLAVAVVASAKLYGEQAYQSSFTQWMVRHEKTYDATNMFARYNTYKRNLDLIDAHNAIGNATYTLAMNHLGDLTRAEYRALLGLKPSLRSPAHFDNTLETEKALSVGAPVAASVDWRMKKAVTPVKNQGSCGSCWSFATTGVIEGALAVSTGSLVSLSEQQLIDCSSNAKYDNQGCNGGLMDNAFQYLLVAGGITTEALYPYMSVQSKCRTKMPAFTAKIASFVDVPPQREDRLAEAANLGPVAVAVEADSEAFQFYSSGVFNDQSCGTALDHAVLLVGYGTDARAGDYWIIKNSWGPQWGDKGYIRLQKGNNMCGVSLAPSYPTGVTKFNA